MRPLLVLVVFVVTLAATCCLAASRDLEAAAEDCGYVVSDGSMIYPGPEGPINSVRWELTRDGIEDYDMMVMLAEKACGLQRAGQTKLAAECRQTLDLRAVTTDWTKYTDSPAVLMAKRQAVGDMLARVLNDPAAKMAGVKDWYNDPWWNDRR